MSWVNDSNHMLVFGRVLNCAGVLPSVEDVFYYFEKPWKWDNEHEAWVDSGSPADPSAATWAWFLQLLRRIV